MGALYIVATPIGNLEDVTHRALRVLAEADLVACEDTRRTWKLLQHYGLKATLTPFHSYNMRKAAAGLLRALQEGKSVALVTDGGTPGVSDPGSYLVALAREHSVAVVPVPGPSALAAAMSVAGPLGSPVTFAGFLSPKPGRRRRQLEQLLSRKEALVLFEGPHRIQKLLAELRELAAQRNCLLGREMTKMHEEFLHGPPELLLTELSARATIKGEFTVVVMPDKKHQVESGE